MRDSLKPSMKGKQLHWLGVLCISVLVGVVVFFSVRHFYYLSPQRLYHLVWMDTRDYIYDPAALGNWSQWEHKYDGKLKTNDDATTAINAMLGSIKDQYTRFLDRKDSTQEHEEDSGITGIGLQLSPQIAADGKPVTKNGKLLPKTDADGYILVTNVMEESPAERARLKIGDAIMSVNGVSTRGEDLELIVNQIRGKLGTKVTLRVRHIDGSSQVLEVRRQLVNLQNVTVKHLDNDIGYIRLENLSQDNTVDEFESKLYELKDCKAIVFDLRDDPGGRVDYAIAIAQLFIDNGTIVSIKERDPGDGYETEVYGVTPDHVYEQDTSSQGKVNTEEGQREPFLLAHRPVVVLVNEDTASGAELVTGALKDNRAATVLGTKTFGKGIGQAVLEMPNNTELHVTSLRYFTPNGTWIGDGGNSVSYGIAPDVEVNPNKGLQYMQYAQAGDNQLKAAVKLLRLRLETVSP